MTFGLRRSTSAVLKIDAEDALVLRASANVGGVIGAIPAAEPPRLAPVVRGGVLGGAAVALLPLPDAAAAADDDEEEDETPSSLWPPIPSMRHNPDAMAKREKQNRPPENADAAGAPATKK